MTWLISSRSPNRTQEWPRPSCPALVALACLILFWKTTPSIRLSLAAALLLYVLADVLTFAYFYPRNAILFVSNATQDGPTLKKVWMEWSPMNWLRTMIVLAGLALSMISLHRCYNHDPQRLAV
ncbi:anthrone oxygenase family protein [Puia dinghuensis]|uniref:anthrone oxygenase family protein n=1 Tax=Puia dinghuensis TaxID=1792502 RepID=UPI0021D28017|nr:anthrone oxygenase family protein [Puia dinghuensis]